VTRLRAALAALAVAVLASSAAAKPAARSRPSTPKVAAKTAPTAQRSSTAVAPDAGAATRHDGAHARVAISRLGDLRPARDVVGRREEPLTAEEDTAKQIEKLLRGPLRYGVTGLFVADARTGEALFSVNADDPLNPASNVKMISTATALELLGADFRYPTRLLGAAPEAGVVHGNAYLLGSYDPTLTVADLEQLAAAVAARGVTRIDGSLIVGSDPSRDGLFRAVLPVEVHATEPGQPAVASWPTGMELIAVKMLATTARPGARGRLSFRVDPATDAAGHPRIAVTVTGTIAKGRATSYSVITRERTAAAAYYLRGALAARGITVAGDYKVAELGNFIGDAVAAGGLPVELGRHESMRLADIIAHVNKWSINWLADRVIMTAAALVKRQPPSMELALAAMYDWLDRHPRIAKDDLVVDTGSGLSYRTRITTHELVSIVRSAAGFTPDGDADLAKAWLASLSVAGTDGTLGSRFRSSEARGRIHGKTGTLSTAIALSGILDLDPQRPLAFSLVTNGDTPLSPRYIRHAHEQVVGLLCRYLIRTRPGLAAPAAGPVLPPPPPAVLAPPGLEPERSLDELEPESSLDEEAAAQH
jgi:D-alanyl-D-alanine carboxypeptidase/D-alanyl-D-alanine-endopeptidase (penicillin-binding protein 4)